MKRFRLEHETVYGGRVLQAFLERRSERRMTARQTRRLVLGNVGNPPPDEVDLVLGEVDRRVDRLHDDVDDHGDQCHAEQQVRAGGQEELGVFGYDVPEADRAERDEGEVERLEVGPALPLAVDEDAEQNVEDGNRQRNDRRQIELVVHLRVDRSHIENEMCLKLPQP